MRALIKVRWLVVLFYLLILSQPAFADSNAKLIGIWKLVSYEVETQSTGQKEPILGKNPTGYAIFTREGRAFFMLTGEGRKAAKTTDDRAKLLDSLIAYSGIYRIEGDKWIINVDVAWNPEWVGTEQTRYFKRDGEHLQVLTPWRIMPNWAEKGMTRSIITFERGK